jgi:hypothetical protein
LVSIILSPLTHHLNDALGEIVFYPLTQLHHQRDILFVKPGQN